MQGRYDPFTEVVVVRPLSAAVAAVRAAAQKRVLKVRGRVVQASTAPAADLKPCRLCGHTHVRRMYALMTHWYGHYVDLPDDHGYFYLCPRCYTRFIRTAETSRRR
jgi:hypothetical protein